MTDREMLLFCYGALKAVAIKGSAQSNLGIIVEQVEDHLWPPKMEIQMRHLADLRSDAEVGVEE